MRVLIAVTVLLAVLAPAAEAAVEDRAASFLLYTDSTGEVPTTRFDGVTTVDASASTGSAFNRMQAALTARASTGAPLAARLEVAPTATGLHARAAFRSDGSEPPPLAFRFALAEDEGATRFVVRNVTLANASLDLSGAWVAVAEFPRPAATGPLTIVAWANSLASDGRYRSNETLQSVAWTEGQIGPTEQTRKAVLIEHASAPGCEPCAPSDEALLLLASQSGFPARAEEGASYFVPPGLRAALGLAGGALVGVAVWRRRE